MRWHTLIVFCVILTTTLCDPDPKKYKPDSKDKQTTENLTNEEKKFLREVEAKFGIKSDVSLEKDQDEKKDNEDKPLVKPPFPAVIAIEIVNDTDTKSKGKRTIDANLGYGYRTNNGYSYTYFGNPSQDKGKFMIYPYSQHDIPPANPSNNKHSSSSNVVDIQPSQAYELLPVKDEESSYEYKKPLIPFKSNYEKIQGLESPPPPYTGSHGSNVATPPSTLYTVYNGEQFSGLQNQFPKVMSNYFVEPSQFLQNPQYQSAGLTQDHLRSHGSHLEQKVVPVLVLRIPSSYLKNPSAELYANLPQNYPLSRYLNNVNLQELVNQYFKKMGYPFAPQIMSYQNQATVTSAHVTSPVIHNEPQQYAHPYVRPSYTHADYSGIQYSAVQPVMAKYPAQNYNRQNYYSSYVQPQYHQPQSQQQNYEYRYQYVPRTPSRPQNYYVQQQYYSPQSAAPIETYQQQTLTNLQNAHSTLGASVYADNQATIAQQSPEALAAKYEAPKQQITQQYETGNDARTDYESDKTAQPEYEQSNVPNSDYSAAALGQQEAEPTESSIGATYGPASSVSTQYSNDSPHAQSYYKQEHARPPVQKETITIYPSSHPGSSYQKYIIQPESGKIQRYIYQNQVNEDSASKSLIISENYPSKDHTQATALPYGYKTEKKPVQTVSYVTPTPYAAAKYLSQYKVMVPQTVLKNSEQVAYVNSHSLPMHYLSAASTSSEYNPEEEYPVSQQEVPLGSQRAPSFPKNYHSHPKRNVKNDNKADAAKPSKKDQTDKIDQKKSS